MISVDNDLTFGNQLGEVSSFLIVLGSYDEGKSVWEPRDNLILLRYHIVRAIYG